LFCVLHDVSSRYSAVNGPKLDPSLNLMAPGGDLPPNRLAQGSFVPFETPAASWKGETLRR
jgi:hypothetical protein